MRTKATKHNYIYVDTHRRMNGLPQGGLIEQELLEERLNKEGYHQSTIIDGLWSHEWHPIQFTLLVDDFDVKYSEEKYAQHLVQLLRKHYDISKDWKGINTLVSPWIGTTSHSRYTSA